MSVIAGFSLFIFHLLFATSIGYANYIDGSRGSSTYNLSRNKEVRHTEEFRNLFQINHGVFVSKENTSKSDVNVPKFEAKENLDLTDARHASGSGVSSTYNLSRKQEIRNASESRNLSQITDDIYIVNENTSKSNINVPKFVEKQLVHPLLEQYLTDCGYYTVNQLGARMFYVFLPSESNVNDPFILWLNGGPGYSSNIGLFYENGPFQFDKQFLFLRANRWNVMSNILYVDQPIETGFSYANNVHEIRWTLDDVTNDLYNFLQKFFVDDRRPYYSNNKFFIAGESYAGHYAPALALKIIEENNSRKKIYINLIGVAIGNALTDLGIQYGTIPYLARRYGLITEEKLNTLKEGARSCKKNANECSGKGKGKGKEDSVNTQDFCEIAFSTCDDLLQQTVDAAQRNINVINIDEPPSKYGFLDMTSLLNQDEVKRLLGVPQDKVFTAYNNVVFNALKRDWAKSSQATISAILGHGIKVLTYAGDADLQFNHVGTMMCARELQWLGQEGFKNITQGISFKIDDEEKGLLFTHQLLSYMKVSKAGQMVLIDQPLTGIFMMHEWMQDKF